MPWQVSYPYGGSSTLGETAVSLLVRCRFDPAEQLSIHHRRCLVDVVVADDGEQVEIGAEQRVIRSNSPVSKVPRTHSLG